MSILLTYSYFRVFNLAHHPHVSACQLEQRPLGRPTAAKLWLSALAGLMLVFAISATAGPTELSDPSPATHPNLINNGDFTHGAAHWTLQSDAPANAKGEMLDAELAPPGVTSKVLRVNVTAIGDHNWKVQLYQPGLDIDNGEPYALSFWARADRARTIDLNMALDQPDWHPVGLLVTHTALTRKWHKFVLAFTAGRTRKEHNRLSFVLGDSPGQVDLADVSLKQGSVGAPSGANLLDSADFVDNLGDWSLQQSAPAKAKLDWITPQGTPTDISGKVARLSVTAVGEHDWNAQFLQSGLDLVDGEPYTLSFWARADNPRTLGASMGLDMQDWHSVGLDYQTNVTPVWHKYSLVFTATQAVKDHNRLAFLFGDALGDVELAGVRLQHNLPSEDNPPATFSRTASSLSLVGTWESRSEEASKRLQLGFNADGTGSIQTGAVAGSAPTGPVNAFHWYLKDRGMRLIVSDRSFTWSIRSSGRDQILTLTDRKGKPHLLYRK